MKPWIDRRIFTEEQIVTIQPNETMDGIIIILTELDKSAQSSLYLDYETATEFGKQLIDYVNERRAK